MKLRMIGIACLAAGIGASSQAATETGPAAPGAVEVTAQSADSISLSWSAPPVGATAVVRYRIYRNGSPVATVSGTHYNDGSARDATAPTYSKPANTYWYGIASIDSQGIEGPQSTGMIYWGYHEGKYVWPGDYSNSILNYHDSSGRPNGARYDISISATTPYAFAQPYSGPPSVPEYSLEIGGFNYMILDLKPTLSGQSWKLGVISRLPPGDVYNNALVDLANYGPKPVAGQWASYRVPLADMAIGEFACEGSITGSTLTVQRRTSGVKIAPGAWIRGPGIKAATYVVGYMAADGDAGTYTIVPAQNSASTTILGQRSNMYKFIVQDATGTPTNLYYMDNVGFVRE